MANDNSTIRAFIAVPLPAPVKAALQAAGEAMKLTLPSGAVRWVKPAAMHLTLRFLGETPVTSLTGISEVLNETAAGHPSFPLQLGKAGCFPNCRRPRVLWIGVLPGGGAASDALLNLKTDIDLALQRFGWEPEAKSFHPHLTIGRIKNPANLAGFEWQADVAPIQWEASEVQLIESQLLPDGPRYTVRYSAALAAATRG